MTATKFMVAALVALFLFDWTCFCTAQAPGVTGRASPPQSGSHQMNQPPPRTEKQNLSQERVEEIKQLYHEAMKALESRTDSSMPRHESP